MTLPLGVLFLDLQGVMIPSPGFEKFVTNNPIENLACLISSVQKSLDLKIVITSSLRLSKSIEALKADYFQDHRINDYIYHITPVNMSRALEIQDYLNANYFERFVILDDQDDGLSMLYKPNFIKVDALKLLSEQDVKRAIEILMK